MLLGFKVSIIILAHNQLSYTKRSVESLIQTEGLDELVLVDNGSTDGTLDFFSFIKNSLCQTLRCKIVHNAENVGGSRGRNQGAEASTGQVVVFLDNDAYVHNQDWLLSLLAVLAERQEVSLIGPMLVFPPDGVVIQSAGGGVTSKGHIGLLGRGQSTKDPQYNQGKFVAWIPTGCLACRREVFELAGGFDESLGPIAVLEDVDFCFRARANNFQIWYEPSVKVYHYENVTYNNSSFSYQKKELFIRHMRLIRERWGELMASGPLCSNEDIRYPSIRKDYRDIEHPRILVEADKLGSIADHLDGQWAL